MHLKNNYEKDEFNGDIGMVHAVVKYEGRFPVAYDILEMALYNKTDLRLTSLKQRLMAP